MALGNPYLSGVARYGIKSTTAPTQGTVDPTGYIEREQSRSGLASAAQNRMQMFAGLNRGTTAPRTSGTNLQSGSGINPAVRSWSPIRPNGTYGGIAVSPTGRITQNQNGEWAAAPTANPNAPKPQPGGQPAGAPQGQQRGQFQQDPQLQAALQKLMSGDTGGLDIASLLQTLGKPGPGMSDNIFTGSDAQANDERAQMMAQRNKALMSFMTQGQDLETDYANSARQVEQQIPDALRDVLEGFAGRGLAFSSGYAGEVGNANKFFANQQANLAQQRTRGLRDLIMGRIGFDEDYYNGLGAIQTAAARRLAEQAGDLNLNPNGPGIVAPPPLPQIQPGQRPDGTVRPTPGAPGNETESQRLARIVAEVQGGRSLNNVRNSVDMLAGRPGGADYSYVNDTQYLSNPYLLEQRIRDIFTNRGVPIGTAAF